MPTLKEVVLVSSIAAIALALIVMFDHPWLGFTLVIVNFCCAIAVAISMFKD